jgi:L-alanine-DL-glutamate epimerase-like enolase superfamily enzyme
MRIESVDCYVLEVPIGQTVGDSRLSITDVYWVVVELETDTGLVGTGWMGSLGFGPDVLAQLVDSQFADIITGETRSSSPLSTRTCAGKRSTTGKPGWQPGLAERSTSRSGT